MSEAGVCLNRHTCAASSPPPPSETGAKQRQRQQPPAAAAPPAGLALQQHELDLQQQQQQQHQQDHHHHQDEPITIGPLLQLSPPQHETAFWQSAVARRLLYTSDTVALLYSLGAQCLVLSRMQPRGLLPLSYLLPIYFFICTSAVQLFFLVTRPTLHQRYRFKVTAANRVARIVNLFFLAQGPHPSLGRSRAAVGVVHVLRPIISPPLLLLNHSNFVVPLRWALSAQLLTLAACNTMWQYYTCGLASSPTALQVSQACCVLLKRVMHGAGLVFGRPPDLATPEYAAQCEGLPGMLLLSTFVYVLLLLVLPCLVLYLVELSMKLRFLAGRQGVRVLHSHSQALLCTSPFGIAVTVGAAVIGTFFACELLVVALQPLHCTPDNTLASSSSWFE